MKRARLYYAADLIRGAAVMRGNDIHTALAGPLSKLGWMLSPTAPAMLTTLGMAIYFFASDGGFALVIDHVQDICDAGGITGLIELGIRQLRRYRSE